MVLDANRRQQRMTELTHLQQMDVFSTSRLDTCAVLFKLNFHKIFLFYNTYNNVNRMIITM